MFELMHRFEIVQLHREEPPSKKRPGPVFASVVLWVFLAVAPDGYSVTPQVRQADKLSGQDYPIRIDLWPTCLGSEYCATAGTRPAVMGLGTVEPLPVTGSLLPVVSSKENADQNAAVAEPRSQRDMDLGLDPGLRGVRFSIGGEERAANAVRARKRFEINGSSAKAIAIKVADDGSIEVDAHDLLQALEGNTGPGVLEKISHMAGDASTISFDRLRSAGFDVRYDAVRDRVAIDMPDP